MAEEAAQLVAIQVRHDRIGHDGIHGGSQHGFHRLKTIGGDDDAVARALQNNFEIATN